MFGDSDHGRKCLFRYLWVKGMWKKSFKKRNPEYLKPGGSDATLWMPTAIKPQRRRRIFFLRAWAGTEQRPRPRQGPILMSPIGPRPLNPQGLTDLTCLVGEGLTCSEYECDVTLMQRITILAQHICVCFYLTVGQNSNPPRGWWLVIGPYYCLCVFSMSTNSLSFAFNVCICGQ